MNKSWHLSRRSFLQGTGVALALPWMECMGQDASVKKAPKRLASVYFPFGVSLPSEKSEYADWNWFPEESEGTFRFRKSLESLEPLRDQITVLGSLSHPAGRKMGGHDTGDIFLTGAKLETGSFTNTISLDQLAAERIGRDTRFSSLTLSSDGGIGEPTRSMTLAFSREGRPIPALSSPRQIYDRLFGQEKEANAQKQRRRLKNAASILDRVLDHSKSLNRRLGKEDQQKLDEYLSSVGEVEKRIDRAESWLEIPKPNIDEQSLDVEATQEGPKEYIKAIYDLMSLAFRTDSTRVATYMIGQVAGATTIANAFPACLGLPGNWHGLAHGAGKKGGAENLGRFDQFLAENHARFLQSLADAKEGDGSVLDRTLVLYGSSNSRTHNNHNYPLLLAGGKGLGVRHGQYLRYNEKEMRLSNLYLTMLDRLGIPSQKFADSTGEFTDILS